jgi:hypothetical protein
LIKTGFSKLLFRYPIADLFRALGEKSVRSQQSCDGHHSAHVHLPSTLFFSEGDMSTAVLEPVVKEPIVVEPAKAEVVAVTASAPVAEEKWSDPHPLLPVFIAGAISLVISGIFIGSVLIWLAVRHSGIMAP